jgi:hypothetical protein
MRILISYLSTVPFFQSSQILNMAVTDDSPVGSPLSDLSSNAFDEDEEQEQLATETLMPPAKRQKLGNSSTRATPSRNLSDDDLGEISSDTDGEVPMSPSRLHTVDDDDTAPQVTICAWLDCSAGDLGNTDALVEHLQAEHMPLKQKKHACMWGDCGKNGGKGQPSLYGLKQHMKSHTKQRPEMCKVPGRPSNGASLSSLTWYIECDKAFTRTDARHKHMRTNHATEELRPSDPVPKYMQPMLKMAHQKLAMKPLQPQTEVPLPQTLITNGANPPGWTSTYPPELGFTAEEEALGPKELYRLLRRQIIWEEEDGKTLDAPYEEAKKLRKQEWLDKEVLFEHDRHDRRQEALRQTRSVVRAPSPPSEESEYDFLWEW